MNISIEPVNGQLYRSRSPIFYKFEGLLTGNTYTFDVYLSNTTTPSLYVNIQRHPDLNLELNIDIHNIVSNYIRKYIYNSGNTVVYMQVCLNEYTDGILVDQEYSDISRATIGYTDYLDGVNYSKGTIYEMTSEPSTIYIPNNSTNSSYWINYANSEVGGNYIINYTSLSAHTTATIISDFATISTSDKNIEVIKCGYSDISDLDTSKPFTLSVYNVSNLIKTYTIKPLIVCEYNYITFINKFGVWDKIYLYGKESTSTSINYDVYKQNNLNYTDFEYNKNGTYHKYVTNGKGSITINTGWIDENYNQKIDELIVSELVYYKDIPIIITDKDVVYKTHKWDKLINYTFKCELAYDKINNIK